MARCEVIRGQTPLLDVCFWFNITADRGKYRRVCCIWICGIVDLLHLVWHNVHSIKMTRHQRCLFLSNSNNWRQALTQLGIIRLANLPSWGSGTLGFFVQWVECSVVLVAGFFIDVIRGFPQFEWIAAIGGILHATETRRYLVELAGIAPVTFSDLQEVDGNSTHSNVFSVPVINGLGMGIGFLVWGSMQTIVGWSVARFGLFGWLAATEVKHNVLNYIGMIVTLVSGILFIFVKHNDEEGRKRNLVPSETTALESQSAKGSADTPSSNRAANNKELHNRSPSETTTLESYGGKDAAQASHSDLSTSKQMLLHKTPYLIMTMTLAILHGLMVTPIGVLKQRHPSEDPYKVFDYIWSFYSTVFVFSTLYFVLYCIIRREKAYVVRELVLPSVEYGILWTSGMTFWFMAGDRLSQVVVYPITTRLPSIIGALLDVLVYKSITDRRNRTFLAFAIAVGVIGVVMIALSNQSF